MPEHILSLSYGKDSMACFGACEILGWPIDRVVTAEVWATDTIHADLPPMVEFKAYADRIIKERWGIEVEHLPGCVLPSKEHDGKEKPRANQRLADERRTWRCMVSRGCKAARTSGNK